MLVNMGNWEEKTDLEWGFLRGHPQEHYDEDMKEDEERPMHCVVCIKTGQMGRMSLSHLGTVCFP